MKVVHEAPSFACFVPLWGWCLQRCLIICPLLLLPWGCVCLSTSKLPPLQMLSLPVSSHTGN